MQKLVLVVIVVVLAAASTGCNSCGSRRSSWFSWWNRGDSCRTCNGGEVYAEEPGLLGAPIMNNVPAAPRSTIENLPGPITVPLN